MDLALVKLLLVILTQLSITNSKIPDWLIVNITTPTKLIDTQGILRLTNGIISKEFTTKPDFAAIDFYSHEKDASLLRSIVPEAVINLDGIIYNIGGLITTTPRAYLNRTDLINTMDLDQNAFHYASHKMLSPVVPFPYTPMRGAPKNINWPPKGQRLDVTFKAPFWAPEYHQMVTVTVHYEMYDGIPLLSKWISVDVLPAAKNDVTVSLLSAEYLALNRPWAPDGLAGYGWLYVETDQSHGTSVKWGNDPAESKMPGSFEPIVNCTYNPVASIIIGDGFESFKVHELLTGTSDPERASLARHRLMRLLAPHTQENPIFFHMTDIKSKPFRALVDQLVEVGFEMIIYSFWSGFNLESTDEKYIQQLTSDIAYANKKGIEVGGYDLIALTRHTESKWMAVDPRTHKPGGSACFASDWYDVLLDKVLSFINRTGLSMVETDGPYGGYACASESHKHHNDVADSVYQQQRLQGKFYNILREKNIYINQPDYFFYQGGSKTGMGYSESQYSLPRWEDLSISRQSVFDDTFKFIPTAGWMFVPLVDYHGGGKAAMFEPLSEHKLEFEWALAQYLGAGVAACYRGFRIYDSNDTKAIVTKWVSFYKAYRDILTSDIVHVRRPDMQSIDSFMHVNPFLKNKGLVMVFNPTDNHFIQNLTIPLYYTGLTDIAMVSHQGGTFKKYQIDKEYQVDVGLDMVPYNITWFVIQ